MIRQNIIIDGTTYIVDMYDAIEDLSKPPCTPYYAQFMMIRNGSLVNDIYSETDILLIEKSIVESCTIDGSIDLESLSSIIAFPITSTQQVGFSKKYTDFNADLNKYNFKIGGLIEKIYDLSEEAIADYGKLYELKEIPSGQENTFDNGYNDGFMAASNGEERNEEWSESVSEEYVNGYNYGYDRFTELGPKSIGPEASIPCDKILVYGPTVKSLVNAIFDVKVFVNGINFHLLCRKSDSLETNSDTEFKVGNFTYSEFLEMFVPNVNLLLEKEKYYFKDIYNMSGFTKKTVLSAIKVEETTKVVNEVKKKLNYTNGNLMSIEDCDYVYEGDDTTGRIFDKLTEGSLDDGEEQPHATPSTGPGKYIIDVSPKPAKKLIETTKYIINKKTVKTRHVLFDENVTIIQSFALSSTDGTPSGTGIMQTLKAVMSSNLMATNYDVLVKHDGGNEDILLKNNQGTPTSIFGSKEYADTADLDSVIIRDHETHELVASVKIDNNEIKCIMPGTESLENGTVACSLHMLEMPFIIEKNDILRYNRSVGINFTRTSFDNEGTEMMNMKTYYEDDANGTTVGSAFQTKFIMYPTSSCNSETSRYVADADMNLDIFSRNYHVVMQNSFKFFIPDNEDTSNKGALVIDTKFSYPDNFSNVNEAYLYLMNESIYNYASENDNEEFDEDAFPSGIDKCGFSIDIATDKKFRNIVYNDIVNIDVPNEDGIVIDDMTYSLSAGNLNVDWKSYPDILIARVKYYDKHTGTVIEGNHLMITKEVFKYLVNTNVGRRININKLKAVEDMNFIDKINCTIVKNETTQVSSTNDIAKASPKVLYRPIFYKARDLDQMKIKSGITQNIGLNLSSLMSKVDTFKLDLEGKEYIEIGRNDAYVIFKVNALELNSTAGQYNILNQDNEFISDGTWYTY